MAPARKKAGRAASKTDGSNNSSTNTNTNISSTTSSSAAASTKQRVPPQPVSTRPKRHAEKRFYDDIEDERPQHLSSKNAKKKSAAAAARGSNNDDDYDEVAPMSNGNGSNGSGCGRGNTKAGRRGAARHGARHADENDQADEEEEGDVALKMEGRTSGGRGGRRSGSGSGNGRGGARSRQPRRRTTVTGWRRAKYPDEMIDDEDDEDEDEEMEGGGGGGGGVYQEDESNSDNWAQCDTCKKWRRLPDFVDPDKLPAKWFCVMNKYDPIRANCRAPQEATTSAQPDEDDERDQRRRRKSRKADHRRRRQDADDDDDEYVDEDEEEDRGGNYDDEGEGEDVQGGEDFLRKEEEALEYDEEEEARDENLRRFMSAWARRVKGAEKAESRLATSMSTRGKRKLMGDTQWIRCQNCGKWRALLRSMDPSTYVGPGLHFYCLMNTWHESLASCSAPQENHYTVANLFPPRDLPSPSATAANYEEHDDDDVGDEAFVLREAGMDRGNGSVEHRRESWGYEHHGGFGNVGAWGEGVGGRGEKRARMKPPAHYNHGYDVQVERDYDYRGKNVREGGCGGQRFLRDEFHF